MSTKFARETAELWNNQEITPFTDENCKLNLNTITNVKTSWDTANGTETYYVFRSYDPGDVEYYRTSINNFKGIYVKKANIGGYEGVLLLPVCFTDATRANIREEKVGLKVNTRANAAFIDKDKNIYIYENYYYGRQNEWIAKDSVTMGFNCNMLQKSKYLIDIFKDVYGENLRYKPWWSKKSMALDDEYEKMLYPSRNVVKVKNITEAYNVLTFLEQKKKKKVSEATLKKNKKTEENAKGIVSGEMIESIENELQENINIHPECDRDFILMRPTEKGIGMLEFCKTTKEDEKKYTLESITMFEKNKTPMYVRVYEDGTYKREKFQINRYMSNNRLVIIDDNMTGPAKYVKDFISANFAKFEDLKVDGLSFYKGNSSWSGGATRDYMTYIRKLFCDKDGLLEKVLKVVTPQQKEFLQANDGEIKKLFGILPEVKSNNLNQLLGINKYQFDTNTDDTVKFIKHITGKTDISGYDKDTWDELKRLFNSSEFCIHENRLSNSDAGIQNDWYFRRIVNSLRTLTEIRNGEISTVDIKRILRITKRKPDNKIRGYENYFNDTSAISRMFSDYLDNLKGIRIRSAEDFETFPIIPSNVNELDELHTRSNALMARLRDISNEELDKKLRVKYQKIKKERSDMEMENDKYMIFCPDDPQDLRIEGRIQSICIGGYVENYARESTMLFFLRKKSEPGVPFFAIEVSKIGVVAQCHGKYNRWLGHNDDSFDAVTFVVEWLLRNKFICNKRILTNQSGSYGSSSYCRDLPDNEIIKKALRDKIIIG